MTISSAICVSKLGKEGSNRIPGFTINSAAAAVPEIALVMLMSDRSKGAPAVAQLHFTREVKSGLLLKADQMISGAKLKNNKDNAAAEQSAKNQILASDRRSSTNPIHGGTTVEAVLSLFDASFAQKPTVTSTSSLASVVEGFCTNLAEWLDASKNHDGPCSRLSRTSCPAAFYAE